MTERLLICAGRIAYTPGSDKNTIYSALARSKIRRIDRLYNINIWFIVSLQTSQPISELQLVLPATTMEVPTR